MKQKVNIRKIIYLIVVTIFLLDLSLIAIVPSYAPEFFHLNSIDNGDFYYSVWTDGTYVYTACSDSGIRAYTFDGTDFTLKGSKDDGSGYTDVWGDGTYIYATDYYGIRAYTFDGSSFTLKNSYDIDNGFWSVHGNDTCIYASVYGATGGLRVLTFNENATEDFWLKDSYVATGEYREVWCNDTHVYVGCINPDVLTAFTFNENGTKELWLKDTEGGGNNYNGVWGNDTYVYAGCSDGIRAYTMVAGSLSLLDTDYQDGEYRGIWGDGNYTYVAYNGIRSYTFDGITLTYVDDIVSSGDDMTLWGDDTYLYTAGYTSGLHAYLYECLPYFDSITLEPSAGVESTTTFFFNCTITDEDDATLSDIKCVINQGVANIKNLSMTWVSGSNITGADYTVSTTFSNPGAYSYYFYVHDGTLGNTSETHYFNVSVNASFQLNFPIFLEVGQYILADGTLQNSTSDPLDGIWVTTKILDGDDWSLISNSEMKKYVIYGWYSYTFSTSAMTPGIYYILVNFTYDSIEYSSNWTLYLSDYSGSGHYATNVHFTFYNSDTGIGIDSESFKIYASTDTVIEATDRIIADFYNVYTGQTIYYRIDDYFDNQIYPSSGDYETLAITSVNQFEDIPIDWYSFSVKNMNHSIVKFNMTNVSRTYTQYLFPYEPFYWNVLGGEYTINLTYYNPVDDSIISYSEENITISDDTYYWITGYDLRDIILDITFLNTSVDTLDISITADITGMNTSINSITTNIHSNLVLSESNLTTLINSYSSNYTIIESIVGYLNTTMWANFTVVESVINTIDNQLTINFSAIDSAIDDLSFDVTVNYDTINTSINSMELSMNTTVALFESNITSLTAIIDTNIALTETNITTLCNTITSNVAIVDSLIDYLNNTIWSNLTVIDTVVDTINSNVDMSISAVNSNINGVEVNLRNDIILLNTNITNINNNILNTINITDSVVDYINNTVLTEFNSITNNISWMNSTTTYVNDTIWNNFTFVGENITTLSVSIHNAVDLSELNLSAFTLNIWNDFNLTDSIIGYLNNTIWNNFTLVDVVIDTINNKLTIDFDLLNVTVDYINNTIWTEINAVNSNIGTVSTLIHSSIVASESNITAINNNIWNSINITDSIVTYLNNTLHNEISAVNVTVDYLNSNIWTNLSLIDSDIDTLSVSVHTNLEVSETNISNIVYNVWSSLNLSNATIDYLNASIWNEIDIINSNLNYTNLTITNMILLTENNITTLLITINNIIDYALTPDIVITVYNPPMIFSVYDKEGMAIGGNIYKICPALTVIATTKVETTGNWINSTVKIPGNNTVTNGTVTILWDELYISSGGINWVNITYTDNGTLYQNTTYIQGKINLYGQNLTINASGDIHILRETTYNQVKKFDWTYYADTGRHTTGIDIINSMDVPMHNVYSYVEFSNKFTPDPTTVVIRDISNDGVILKTGEHYDVTLSGVHFYLLSINSDSTRGFTFEYYKRFDDAYSYGEETINIPGYTTKVWSGLSFNTFEIPYINNENTIFRGGLYAKLDFEGSSDINPSSIRIWDENNNHELNESDFIYGNGFIRIDASGLGDINPGSGRKFSVYFLFKEYPKSDPSEIHLNTALFGFGGFAVTPFLIILIIGLSIIGYGAYSYIFKNKKDWKNGIVIGVFVIFLFQVLAYMGI